MFHALDSVSRRSLALTVFGLICIFMGIRVLGLEVREIDLAIAYEVIPIPIRSALWIVSGTIGAVWAWSKNWQWVSVIAVSFMPIERAFSYCWSFYHSLVPGNPKGSIWSIWDAFIWFSIAILIGIVSGWIEWDKRGNIK